MMNLSSYQSYTLHFHVQLICNLYMPMQQGKKQSATRHTLFWLAGRLLTWDFHGLSREICLHFASSLLIVVTVPWALTLFTVRNVKCGVWACELVEMHVSHGQCVRLLSSAAVNKPEEFQVHPDPHPTAGKSWGIPLEDHLASSPSCSV